MVPGLVKLEMTSGQDVWVNPALVGSVLAKDADSCLVYISGAPVHEIKLPAKVVTTYLLEGKGLIDE